MWFEYDSFSEPNNFGKITAYYFVNLDTGERRYVNRDGEVFVWNEEEQIYELLKVEDTE